MTGGEGGMSICATKKRKVRPGTGAGPQTWGASRRTRGDFSVGGHRLPSLYRAGTLARFWLTIGFSSLPKYPATAPISAEPAA